MTVIDGVHSLAARLALGAAGALATLFIPAWGRLYTGDAKRFDRRLIATLVLSRTLLFCFVFGVLHLAPRGDILDYYWGEANQLMHGGIPYKTIDTIYAPLHTVMESSVLWIVNSPLTLIFFATALEWVALTLWLRLARALWPEQDRTLRIAGLLYLFCPLSLQFVAIDGQTNVVIALFVALSLLCALRYRPLVSGLMLGASITVVKFLPVLYVPAFVLGMPRRWRFFLGGVMATVPVYGLFALYHLNILAPLRQGALKTAGGFAYVVETVFNLNWNGKLWDLLLYLMLAVCYAVTLRGTRSLLRNPRLTTEETHYARIRILLFIAGAITMVLVAFAKKTWPTYSLMALFPLCLAVARQVQRFGWKVRALFALFGLVCVVEHSYWETILHEITALRLHSQVAAHDPQAFILLTLELLLTAGYLWLLWLSLAAVKAESVDFAPDNGV